MQVPDEIRKCVVFLGYRQTNGDRLIGTGFLVTTKMPECTFSSQYLVTAKHVVDAAYKNSMDGRVFVRFNSKSSGVMMEFYDCSLWKSHPADATIDVAVMPIIADLNKLDHKVLPKAFFLSPELIEKEKIGIGDDVFLTGLFGNHSGTGKNIPIVRVGNIAAMPEERVRTRLGDIEAYLIEARSIGGLSGSPVFVMLESMRNNIINSGGRMFLMGLMHGHFDAPSILEDIAVEDAASSGAVNMGIGIVIPSKYIMEVIDRMESDLAKRFPINSATTFTVFTSSGLTLIQAELSLPNNGKEAAAKVEQKVSEE